MANEVTFKIRLNVEGKEQVVEATTSTEALGEALDGAAESSAKLSGAGLGAWAVGIESAMALVDRVKSSIGSLAQEYEGYESKMREVNTMAGLDEAGFERLTAQVDALSGSIPKAKVELADGLYQVISNGVPQDNWLSFLEQSSRASVGGLADLGQTVTVTSTIIKNYGLAWEEAQNIQDKIQLTAKNGVTSFEQLASALPRVSGNAATLGVSVDELMATFATLTGVSGNTAEVSTQLAAVFTALVKPSSEAAEMADQMGIKFDAAAIKAAGGMRNFLTQLNNDVKEYATAHGMLEQEIYSKLFGSAESLRALIPLTGVLASTFDRNIETMKGSAGTIDEAFAQMASTGESTMQLLKNQLQTIISPLAHIASRAMPVVEAFAAIGQAASFVKMAREAIVAFRSSTLAASVASRAAALNARVEAAAMAILRTMTGQATVSMTALRAATIALYGAMSMGLTLAISAVVELLSGLASSSDEAAESMEQTGEVAERLKARQEALTSAYASASAEIEEEKAKLKELIDTKGDATDVISALNDKYGETFGVYQTAIDWYNKLIDKSEDYCLQLAYEAQARLIYNQIAENRIRQRQNEISQEDLRKSGGDKTQVAHSMGTTSAGTSAGTYYTEEESSAMATLRQEAEQLAKEEESLNQELEIAKQEREKHKAAVQTETSSTTQAVVTSNSIQRMSYAELQTAIEQQEKAVSKLAGKSGQEAEAKRQADLLKQMKARYASLGQRYGIKEGSKGGGKNDFDGKHLIASAATYKQLENNIRYYEEQLKKTDPQEKATIQNLTALKQAAEADLQAVKAMLDEYNRPTSLDTLEDIDKEIQYQRTLRSKATADNIGDIDKEIKRLDGLRQALEQSGHVELTTMNISEQVTSYERLNQELTFYQQRLNQANTDVARAEAQALIDRLNELKAAWDAALGSKTGDASKVNTLREVDAALSYWQQHLQTVTGDELTATQATINALQKKRTALMGLANISTGEVELGDLKNLTDKELTIRLRAIGIEGVREKIRALQETLKSGAVTGQQEAAIKGQIAQWQQYEQRLRRADVTFGKVYGDITSVY